jgi:hypothetical protein
MGIFPLRKSEYNNGEKPRSEEMPSELFLKDNYVSMDVDNQLSSRKLEEMVLYTDVLDTTFLAPKRLIGHLNNDLLTK